jgi:hypothetical protein
VIGDPSADRCRGQGMDIAKLWVVNRTGMPQAGRSLTTCATVPRPPAPARHASAALTFGRAGSARLPAGPRAPAGPVQCSAGHLVYSRPAPTSNSTPSPDRTALARAGHRAGRTRFRLPVYYSALHGASARLIRACTMLRHQNGSPSIIDN